MLLVADIGNTSTTLGVFDGETLVANWHLASDKKRSEDEYGVILCNFLNNAQLSGKINAAILSSVVLPLTERFGLAIEKYLGIKPLIVNHKTKTEIKIKLDKPEEIGADRLVNAAAAARLYNLPAIVVDFGTATSFDIINDKKEFLGGLITAGIKIQADALANFTSKLPKVRIEAPKNAIGKNTVDAMLSGLVRGHACMIDGMIEQCECELGQKATVIATGGYSDIISGYLKRPFDKINPDLTLFGLKYIWELNS